MPRVRRWRSVDDVWVEFEDTSEAGERFRIAALHKVFVRFRPPCAHAQRMPPSSPTQPPSPSVNQALEARYIRQLREAQAGFIQPLKAIRQLQDQDMETTLGGLEAISNVHERLSSQLAAPWRADCMSFAAGIKLVAEVFLESNQALLEAYSRYAIGYAAGMAAVRQPAAADIMLALRSSWKYDTKYGWITDRWMTIEEALSLPLAYAMTLRDLFESLRAPTSRASEPSSAALEAVCATLDSINAALARATASHRAAAEGGEGRMLSS